MTSGKSVDLSKRVVYYLGIKRFSAFEECIFITERAVMWATSCDHDRVGNEIEMSFDEISSDAQEFFPASSPKRNIFSVDVPL